LNSVHLLRILMAAVMYLLMVWGHVALQTPQWFAVFAALVMSITLLYWASEARLDAVRGQRANTDADVDADVMTTLHDKHPTTLLTEQETELSAAVSRLDSLKSELNQQYAQFGRDQSLINKNALGLWNRDRHSPRADQ